MPNIQRGATEELTSHKAAVKIHLTVATDQIYIMAQDTQLYLTSFHNTTDFD